MFQHFQMRPHFIIKLKLILCGGVNDETHEVVGTTFNQYGDYNKEPYQNFLARNLSPSINFSFEEAVIDDKRVVVLVIPAAEEIPTAFKEKRYIRIGSSKANLKDYPKRERSSCLKFWTEEWKPLKLWRQNTRN